MKSNYRIFIFGILALSTLLHLHLKSKVWAATEVTLATTPTSVTSPAPADFKSNAKSKKNDAEWRKKMQVLYKTLVEITTDTSSDQRFNAPENKSRIEKNAKNLADRAHDLAKNGMPPDADPTITILSSLFQDETKRAYWALKAGNRPYARGILNQVSSYCIACHTRNDSGPSLSSLPLEPLAKDLYPIEQGRFYAATRQYNRALDLFQKIIGDPSAPIKRPLAWEQAIRYGLSISIRVNKDPEQARSIVERVIGSNKAPLFLKQDALKWKESILKWNEEIPRKATTEEGLRSEAMQLITQARELQKYPMDRGADVLYLRATAVIHELLQKAPDGRYAQETLLMAGMCYQVLKPLALEDIHEIYYEACIKKKPHTAIAETCYKRYEQSNYDGYRGSAGDFLPEDLQQKLERLETLALPETVAEPALK